MKFVFHLILHAAAAQIGSVGNVLFVGEEYLKDEKNKENLENAFLTLLSPDEDSKNLEVLQTALADTPALARVLCLREEGTEGSRMTLLLPLAETDDLDCPEGGGELRHVAMRGLKPTAFKLSKAEVGGGFDLTVEFFFGDHHVTSPGITMSWEIRDIEPIRIGWVNVGLTKLREVPLVWKDSKSLVEFAEDLPNSKNELANVRDAEQLFKYLHHATKGIGFIIFHPCGKEGQMIQSAFGDCGDLLRPMSETFWNSAQVAILQPFGHNTAVFGFPRDPSGTFKGGRKKFEGKNEPKFLNHIPQQILQNANGGSDSITPPSGFK